MFCFTELIEKNNLTEIEEILDNTLGGWPVIMGKGWNENAFNWIQTNYKLLSFGYPTDNLITLSADIGLDDSSHRILMVEEPNFFINTELLRKSINSTLLSTYHKYMVDVAVLFGADRNFAEKELLETLEFASTLANVSKDLHFIKYSHLHMKKFNFVFS